MTLRDIAHHLTSTVGTELSHETISKIVDEIGEEVLAWQGRPLETLYPVIYLDAIVVKVRDGGHVVNKAAHIAVGVDMDGIKHVLGIWVQTTEGAKFWASVCADLANRGIRDVLIVCCDGLSGLPEAIEATWAAATVQNLRGPPDPRLDAVRRLGRAQGRGRGPETDLHRGQRRRRPGGLGAVRDRLGREVPPRGEHLAGRVGTVRAVPGLPARAAPSHLHHQLDRYLEPASGCR